MTDPIHIISLGAGVQSSTMALMAAAGEITPMPKCAIFADTQAEPKSVYTWLDWLENQLPFPVHRVTHGNLWESELRVRRSKKTDKLYLDNNIPAFVKSPNGKIGLLGRKCTSDFKIIPIQKEIRKMTGVKRHGKGVLTAMMWIGISIDEAHRMKPSRVDYIENTWPLIDFKMSRGDCLSWMEKRGFPIPPRSACVFCPFHDEYEWLRMSQKEPEEFERAIKFEKDLQVSASKQEVLNGIPFLYDSCQPLGSIDFQSIIAEKESKQTEIQKQKSKQLQLRFGNECTGMCGV